MLNKNSVYHGRGSLEDAQRRLYFRSKLTTETCIFWGNFLTVNGHFNCVTSRVKALGWLEKKMNIDRFSWAILE